MTPPNIESMRLTTFRSSRNIRLAAGLLAMLCILPGCDTSDGRRSDPVSSETIIESAPVPSPIFIPDTAPEEQRIQGTISLMLTDASFDCQGDWIYYIEDKGIYKKQLSRLDQEATLVLQLWEEWSVANAYEQLSTTIQVAGDWIYYAYVEYLDAGSRTVNGSRHFRRVRTDGKGDQSILHLSDKTNQKNEIIVHGDWVYYEDSETTQTDASTRRTVNFLARKNLNTGEEERITEGDSSHVYLSFIDPQGTVVYARGLSVSRTWSYYCINPGEDEKFLFYYGLKEASSYFLSEKPSWTVTPDGQVYFFVKKNRISLAPTSGIYRFDSVADVDFNKDSIPLPGTEDIKFGWDSDTVKILATDDILYLGMPSQKEVESGMYQYSSIDGAFTKINNDSMQPLFVYDGYLYYEISQGLPQYRCRLNGTEWESLSW